MAEGLLVALHAPNARTAVAVGESDPGAALHATGSAEEGAAPSLWPVVDDVSEQWDRVAHARA